MFEEFPIPTGRRAQLEPSSGVMASDSQMHIAVRQFFQPYVLAFVALSIAVGGWSYGYKLSQYLHHPEVSKASATRMWVDHRDQSVTVPAKFHTRPQRISEIALFAFSAQRLPRLSRDHAVTTPAPARVTLIISSHIPFRAPPSLHPSQA
ncbi:MAG: hypothetical protein WBQ95_04915 [Terracidiphilus sp.]